MSLPPEPSRVADVRAAVASATESMEPTVPVQGGVVAGVVLALTAMQWGVIFALAVEAFPDPAPLALYATAVLASAAPVLVLLRGLSGRIYPSAAVRRWVLRPFWYVQLGLPLLTVATVMGALLGLASGWPFDVVHPAARGGLIVAVAAFLAAAAAGYLGAWRLRVRRLTFAFDDLPDALDGLTVAQLSDLHIGPHTSTAFLRRVHRAVERAAPDLIVFTGDQVDDYARDTEVFAEAFAGLSAPMGAIAVAGNHDVYAGWRAVRRGLEAAGLTVLVNEARAAEHPERPGAALWLAGVGDPAGEAWSVHGGAAAAPDVEAAFAEVPEGAFVLALAHNPALWPALARHGARLTLSGHTHYGQVALPRLGWCLASPFVEYAMGTHHAEGGATLYINPGTNYWGLPLRLGAWPEVSLVTLRRAQKPAEEGSREEEGQR